MPPYPPTVSPLFWSTFLETSQEFLILSFGFMENILWSFFLTFSVHRPLGPLCFFGCGLRPRLFDHSLLACSNRGLTKFFFFAARLGPRGSFFFFAF